MKINFLFLLLLLIMPVCSAVNINITACSNLNTSGATYLLTSDLIYPVETTCFRISVSNIILDCQNHLIKGTTSYPASKYAIYASSYLTNITIKNCRISDWPNVFYLSKVDFSNFFNISCDNGGYHSIGIYDCSNNIFRNFTLSSQSIYIDLDSSNNIFDSMTFQDGSTAECIDMRNCSNNTFTNLTISGCEGAIYLYESSRNVYSNITVYGNSLGFYIQKSTNNTFRDIVSKFNSNYGLYVESSVNNTFLSVTSLSNHVGFGFIHSDSNKIERSIIDSNGIGIKLTDSGVRWPNRIYNNLIKNNTYNLDSDLTTNIWNTTISAGQRIYSNGTEIGGNYWGRSNSSTFGFSETCNDSDNNGFCDSLYVLDSSNIDYLPLSNKYIWTSITTSTTITTTTTATTTTTPFLGVVLNQPSSGSNASSNVSLNFTVVGSNLTYNASLNLNGSVNNQTVDNIQNNTLSSWDLTSLSPGVYWWNVTAWINSSVHNVSETWNFTVTTTTTVTTMTATTSTTMTIPAECELAGNYAPCDTVSLSEVINLINLWVNNTVTLSDVITLITVWANGSGI